MPARVSDPHVLEFERRDVALRVLRNEREIEDAYDAGIDEFAERGDFCPLNLFPGNETSMYSTGPNCGKRLLLRTGHPSVEWLLAAID